MFCHGIIAVPGAGVNSTSTSDFLIKLAYACMSETMLMALKASHELFTLGRELSVEQVERIGAIAKDGFNWFPLI